MSKVRVLVVGLGQMGLSHALAYHANAGFEIVGLVNRSMRALPVALQGYPVLGNFKDGLQLKPDLVAINTHTDTHASFALAAMEAGAHVFVEKPLAETVEEAKDVVAAAKSLNRKLVVGYILRHHPMWQEFIKCARQLEPPFVMRFNLNQQSSGTAWLGHKRLLEVSTPLVDVGVHYIDVMLQIVASMPVQVRGMGARIADDIGGSQVNYGHLQVLFGDGSIGWFESGFGPMMSETAYFIKDVIGRKGSASIVTDRYTPGVDINVQTAPSRIRLHHADLGPDGQFLREDTFLSVAEQPDHQDLCNRQQSFVLEAIRNDRDLSQHMDDAVRSLAVVLTAEASMREGIALPVH